MYIHGFFHNLIYSLHDIYGLSKIVDVESYAFQPSAAEADSLALHGYQLG